MVEPSSDAFPDRGNPATARAGGHAMPAWLSLTNVWRAAAALVALVLLACGLLGWSGYQQALGDAQRRGELLAGVLADHLTRTIDTSAIALGAMADVAGGRADAVDPIQLGPTLSQSILALPTMRSVAVLDLHGRVLASSSMDDVDRVIDLRRLGEIPPPGHAAVGHLVNGRHLRDAAVGSTGVAPVSFLPLVRHFVTANRQPLLLVGLINPDGLANFQRLALSDGGGEIVWTANLDGEVIAIGGDDGRDPVGRIDAGHPLWQRLSQLDHASTVGAGLDGSRRLISYRTARDWPLVVGVEQPMSGVLAAWWRGLRFPLVISLVASLFIVGLAYSAARNLRERLAARREIDLAHARVEQRERELSVVVKSLQELIFRTDASGVIRFVNARWLSLPQAGGLEPVGRSPS